MVPAKNLSLDLEDIQIVSLGSGVEEIKMPSRDQNRRLPLFSFCRSHRGEGAKEAQCGPSHLLFLDAGRAHGNGRIAPTSGPRMGKHW